MKIKNIQMNKNVQKKQLGVIAVCLCVCIYIHPCVPTHIHVNELQYIKLISEIFTFCRHQCECCPCRVYGMLIINR